jgi:Protein of unknown function (DUF4199)
MQPISKYRIGIRFGLITGLLYMVLLFIRNRFFAQNPDHYVYATFVIYFLVLVCLLFAGISRKAELNGYATMQEIFQSIFITILITELCYVLFNLVYLKFVNPGFPDTFKNDALIYFQSQHRSQQEINAGMESVQALMENVKPGGLLKGFGTSVVIDSIFGFIFAAIFRRKKPIPKEPK